MKRNVAWSLTALVGAVVVYAGTLLATPANPPLFTSPQMLKATLDEIDLNADDHSNGLWRARLKTKGLTDMYVVTNVWKPGGTTGWHTHPGPSIIMVTAGQLTAYDGDDPTCTPHVFSVGASFIDPGEGHTHVIRNEGTIDASTTAVQFVPTQAGPANRRAAACAMPGRALTRDGEGSSRQCPASGAGHCPRKIATA